MNLIPFHPRNMTSSLTINIEFISFRENIELGNSARLVVTAAIVARGIAMPVHGNTSPGFRQ